MTTVIFKINKVKKLKFNSIDEAAEFASIKFCLTEKDKKYLKQYAVVHRHDYDIKIEESLVKL